MTKSSYNITAENFEYIRKKSIELKMSRTTVLRLILMYFFKNNLKLKCKKNKTGEEKFLVHLTASPNFFAQLQGLFYNADNCKKSEIIDSIITQVRQKWDLNLI